MEIPVGGGALKAVMLATVAALLLSCKMVHPQPPPPPSPVTVRCEGADRVTRNHDRLEVHRAVNACTQVRCEGADRVRRTFDGAALLREVNACTVARCEGADWVVRTHDGETVARASFVRRCLPQEPVVVVRPPPQPDVARFGLSYR